MQMKWNTGQNFLLPWIIFSVLFECFLSLLCFHVWIAFSVLSEWYRFIYFFLGKDGSFWDVTFWHLNQLTFTRVFYKGFKEIFFFYPSPPAKTSGGNSTTNSNHSCLMKFMYSRDSCNIWIVSTRLNALTVSCFGQKHLVISVIFASPYLKSPMCPHHRQRKGRDSGTLSLFLFIACECPDMARQQTGEMDMHGHTVPTFFSVYSCTFAPMWMRKGLYGVDEGQHLQSKNPKVFIMETVLPKKRHSISPFCKFSSTVTDCCSPYQKPTAVSFNRDHHCSRNHDDDK